jgi:hypothetical protein
MKPSVRFARCPVCDAQAWVVRGPAGAIWRCTRNWRRALDYALERAAQTPGTGAQVQTHSKEMSQ